MKKTIKNLMLLTSAIFLGTGCDDMNSLHQGYLDEGEKIYIGVPEIRGAFGGYERIELRWLVNADPKIENCLIKWNNGLDSVVIPVVKEDTLNHYILPIPEGKYNFQLTHTSKDGYTSLKREISGQSYGPTYRNGLYPREITQQLASPEQVVIEWANTEGCIGVNFEYENKDGVLKELYISSDEKTTKIEDYLIGGTFTYTSLYIPEIGAIDTISTLPEKGKFPFYYIVEKDIWESEMHPSYPDIDRTDWVATATTEEMVGEGAINGRVATILDNNPATFWHSQWQVSPPDLPHTIDVDMIENQTITSIEIARRQNNKDTKTVVCQISDNKVDWEAIGKVTFPNATTPNSKVLVFPNSIRGRYLRLLITEVNNTGRNASLSGIYLTTK